MCVCVCVCVCVNITCNLNLKLSTFCDIVKRGDLGKRNVTRKARFLYAC